MKGHISGKWTFKAWTLAERVVPEKTNNKKNFKNNKKTRKTILDRLLGKIYITERNSRNLSYVTTLLDVKLIRPH